MKAQQLFDLLSKRINEDRAQKVFYLSADGDWGYGSSRYAPDVSGNGRCELEDWLRSEGYPLEEKVPAPQFKIGEWISRDRMPWSNEPREILDSRLNSDTMSHEYLTYDYSEVKKLDKFGDLPNEYWWPESECALRVEFV